VSAPAIPPTPLPGGGPRTVTSSTPPPVSTAPANLPGGSEVYRIEKDDYARKVWSNGQDIVYTIAFDAAGLPLVGTGNKGKIFRIDSDRSSTLLLNALPTQITGLYNAPKGRLYAVTGNIGKVYQLGPELEKQGTYESDPLDASFFSYWGRLGFKSTGQVHFEARSGNLERPQKTWSPWSTVDQGAGWRVAAPPARFLQYKATLSGADAILSEVEIAYQGKNVAPSVDDIEITPPNYKFPAPPVGVTASSTITLPPMGQRRRPAAPSADSSSSQTLTLSKGFMGARWAASDPNNDDLAFKVEIRGSKEKEWKLLRDKVKERYLSWDSATLPDGEYLIQITATDAPGNIPAAALSASLVSDPFLIDNTPPQITGLTGTRTGGKLQVRFKAKDVLSLIDKAEYSIDGHDWTLAAPTTRLTDANELTYDISIEGESGGEHTVAVRVTDEFDNQSVEKVVIR
jgi:hypothetical protein